MLHWWYYMLHNFASNSVHIWYGLLGNWFISCMQLFFTWFHLWTRRRWIRYGNCRIFVGWWIWGLWCSGYFGYCCDWAPIHKIGLACWYRCIGLFCIFARIISIIVVRLDGFMEGRWVIDGRLIEACVILLVLIDRRMDRRIMASGICIWRFGSLGGMFWNLGRDGGVLCRVFGKYILFFLYLGYWNSFSRFDFRKLVI